MATQPQIDEDDFDTTSALADISADLFGQGGSDGETVVTNGEAEKVPAEPSVVEPAPSPTEDKPEAETTEEVQATGAPKTWTKEALSEWATISPRAQQEILKREEDFLKGITQYKGAAEVGQRYDAVIEPYRPALQAENIDPVQLFQSFAANHYLLSRGTPEQKLDLAASLISGYGIDPTDLIIRMGEAANADPRIAQLEAENRELRQVKASVEEQQRTATLSKINEEIVSFAADPTKPFFNDLVDDIAQLFANGQAKDLSEAYEKAVYLNPTTRQKELDRLTAERLQSQTAEEQAKQARLAASQAANITSHQKPGNGTVPLGSMDDTLAETMARISSRA